MDFYVFHKLEIIRKNAARQYLHQVNIIKNLQIDRFTVT